MRFNSASDVVVVGAGAIGAAVAWQCARRGLSVALVDRYPDRGAWRTAAGMLAPITELHYTETTLLQLNLESLRRYPSFVDELEGESDLSVGLRETGTVAVAWDGADLAGLQDLQRFAEGLGVESSMVSGRELRELEPALAAGLPGALLAPGDHQVDPRLLHAALTLACRRQGVRVITASARVVADHDRARGVVLDDGTSIAARHVVLAAGCWSATVEGVPDEARPAVRPVKGQTLRLSLPGALRLHRVVRGAVRGTPIYIVPRADGSHVVGASVDEAGFDTAPRTGAVYELLRDAQSLFPELSESVFDEVSTGLRPGSPDNAPLIGPSSVEGLVHATGHFRNGILLTPVTADGIATLLADGALPESLAPFTPTRFAEVTP